MLALGAILALVFLIVFVADDTLLGLGTLDNGLIGPIVLYLKDSLPKIYEALKNIYQKPLASCPVVKEE